MTNNKALWLLLCTIILGSISNPSVCNALIFKMDRFTVVRNGILFFDDTFSDGLSPPSAPNFTNGTAALYFTTGSFGSESGGKLTIDSDKGVVSEPIFGEIPFLIQAATLNTNTDPSNLALGLKIDDTFEVRGIFDLAIPTTRQERYAIRLRDRTPANIGNDNLDLSVRRTLSGDLRIQFRRFDYVTETITVFVSVPVETSHNQIELILNRPTTSSNLVFASFAYIDGGVRGPVTVLGSAPIFRGENFTRAGFTVQKPAVSTRFGPGGTASNPSGSFSDPVNTATGNYLYQRSDFSVAGRGFPFVFTRTYNSLDNYAGPFSQGWTHTYNVVLTENADGSVAIKHGDGRQEFYEPIGDGTFVSALGGIFNKLTKALDGTFRLTSKNQTQHHFTATGKLASISDRNGNALFLAYNPAGNLTAITDTAGRTFQLAYDASNRIIRLTDPIGRIVQYGYDIMGNLVQVTDPSAGVVTFRYNANRLDEIRDEMNNVVVSNIYDDAGRVNIQTNGRGFSTIFAYDAPTEGDTTLTDQRGNAIIHRHDALLRLVEVIDASGKMTRFSYDQNNNRTASTDQNNNATLFTYDTVGNVTSIIDPLGNTVRFTYDSQNNLTSARNARGFVTLFHYDPQNNLVQIVDAVGNTTAFAYDSLGQLIRKTDARGNATQYTYDPQGNLTRITNALGGFTNLAYDGIGRLLSLTDPNGRTAKASYDLNNRLKDISDPLGNKTQFAYDPVGSLTEITDAKGNKTRYDYDPVYNLTKVTDALNKITQYTYDENNNRTRLIDANNNTTTYQFDPLNRLTRIADPLGNATIYGYDPAGNVTAVKDANGTTNVFTYDANNRLTRIDYGDGNAVTFSYDSNGNRIRMVDPAGTTNYTYDQLDRVVQVDQPTGAVDYIYDAVGNRTALVYPDDSVVTYSYDALNRLATVKDKSGKVTRYTYDLASNLKNVAYPNGNSIAYSYDAANRLVKVQNRDDRNKSISSFEYLLDPLGNRVRISQDGKHSTNYTYDVLSQLVAVQEKDKLTKYTYDAVGNRLTMTRGKERPTVYSYDPANRLLSAGDILFFHDANGNRIRKQERRRLTDYVYDAANRLVRVTQGNEVMRYGYDGDGNKFARELEKGRYTEWTNFVNDVATPLPVIISEQDSKAQVNYVYGLGPISQTEEKFHDNHGRHERSDKSFEFFYHFDGLGSVMSLSDSRGNEKKQYRYDAWGNTRNGEGDDDRDDDDGDGKRSDPPNRFRFTGEEFDGATGLYYLRARWYDPSVGRFLTRDPLRGSTISIRQANDYLYVLNNPVKLVDPTGLSSVERRMTNASTASVGLSGALESLGDSISWLAKIVSSFRPVSNAGKAAKPGVGLELTLSQIAVEHAKEIEVPQLQKFCSSLAASYSDNFDFALDQVITGTPSNEASIYIFSASRYGLTSVLVNKLTKRTDVILSKVKTGEISQANATKEFQDFVRNAQTNICH